VRIKQGKVSGKAEPTARADNPNLPAVALDSLPAIRAAF